MPFIPTPGFDPYAPIPNNPFSYPESYFLQGAAGPIVVGTGIYVDYNAGTINSTGGGGGAVSQIIAGTGISVSPAGGVGAVTVSLAGGAAVTAVTATSPLQSSGGATPDISMVASGVVPGSYTYPTIAVDTFGRITSASDGVAPNTTVTAPITNTGTPQAPVIGIQTATTGQLGAVQVGTNIDVAAGTISVKSSSTTQSGIVQLNDTVASTSTTEALTAAQGKVLQDQINALTSGGGLTLAGTFDAAASQMLTVSASGSGAGFTVGANLPAPAVGNTDYFVIVTTGGSYSPPGGGGPYTASQGDWFLSNGTTWQYLNVGVDLPIASTGTAGIVELATSAETQAGTDATRAVTPAGGAATYVPLTALTAKGALISATAANTAATLTVGTNGQVLTADSACASGIKWSTLSASAATPTVLGTVFGCTIDASATGNVSLGKSALGAISTGSQNVAIGSSAGCNLTDGVNNVAVGLCSLFTSASGLYNTAVGYKSMPVATNSYANTAIGACAGRGLTTGRNNTFLGGAAGGTTTTGSYNTAIGIDAYLPLPAGDFQLVIGASSAFCWLTGCSNKAIRPGAGIMDCAGSTGTAGQVLMSNGANAICWGAAGAGGPALSRTSTFTTASGSAQTVIYNVAECDTTSLYNGANGVFTPTQAGWYQFNAVARVGVNTANNCIGFVCNGVAIALTSGNLGVASLSTMVYMPVGSALCVQISSTLPNSQSGVSRFTALKVA